MSGRPCSPQRAAVPVQDVVRLAGRRAGAPRRGDPRQLCRWGLEEFTAAVRRGLPRWHGIRPTLRIVRAVSPRIAPVRWSERVWSWPIGSTLPGGWPTPKHAWSLSSTRT
ncbi:MAG: hypothetical protein ACRDS9_19820, partial [Pseudonocardiaceae bacterium]